MEKTGGNVTFFSHTQVELMLNALRVFDEQLNRVGAGAPNREFARNTLTALNGKLRAMLDEKNDAELFGLDANEVLLLHASLMIFSLGLALIEESARKRHITEDCALLLAYFAPMLPARPLQA